MQEFELTVLGSNSAKPAYGRYPTSQVLRYGNQLFLIDCGEGTQLRFADYKIKRNNIRYIFISHHHGDHLYGLPGVITSMSLYSRKSPLHIFGPKGIKKFIDVLFEIGEVHLNFDLQVTEISCESMELLIEDENLKVETFPVYHRIPTYGFRFSEKQQTPNIRKESIGKFQLSIDEIKMAKQGSPIYRDDVELPLSEIMYPQDKPRSYAYCADSKTDDRLIPYVEGVDLLYFETTYLDELRDQAIERGHATAAQAAQFAKKANVGRLLTGHYSSRYKDVSPIKDEALRHFDNVVLGYDGVILNI